MDTKSPDQETQTPTRIQPPQPLSSTNGVLKQLDSDLHNHQRCRLLSGSEPVVITYKECLKNHAASLGGHAVDGCGEFMPSPTATHTDPTSLKCAACGCHRNFHRREPDDYSLFHHPTSTTATIEYQSHHRHHPLPPPFAQQLLHPYRSPNSASPPPISSSFPGAHHMLFSLSGGGISTGAGASSSSRKRFRTKFSQNQKERMHEFAERLGWKLQRKDEELIQEFCSEIGVNKGALKVWIHNNKNTFGKRESAIGNGTGSNNLDQTIPNNDNRNTAENVDQRPRFENHDNEAHADINGSSSSS